MEINQIMAKRNGVEVALGKEELMDINAIPGTWNEKKEVTVNSSV